MSSSQGSAARRPRFVGRVTDERLALAVQMAVAFLAITTMAGTRPTTTYRALALGASSYEVGLVQSAYSVLPAITAVFVGRWVDRLGEIRIYAISLAVLAAGSAVSGLAESLAVLATGQALIGFGTVAMLIAGQALIANRSHPESWNRNYGTYSAFLSLGQLLGPSAAATLMTTPGLSAVPERPAFYAGAAVSALGAVLILLLPHIPHTAKEASAVAAGSFRQVVARILRRPGMLGAMFISIVVLSAIDIILAYLPVLGEVKGIPVQVIGLLLSVRAATTLVSRLFMDRLLRRLGWVPLLAGSLAIASAMLVFLPLSADTAVLVVLIGVFGFGLGFGQPMAVTFVASRATKADRATALGVRLTANRFSLMFVPAAMGVVAGSAGVDTVFWVLAAVMGAGALVASRAGMDGAEPSGAQPSGAEPSGAQGSTGAATPGPAGSARS